MANPAFAQSFHIATTSTILDDSMTWLAHSDLAIAGVISVGGSGLSSGISGR